MHAKPTGVGMGAFLAAEDIVPIPGTKKLRYVDENVAAAKVQLTQQELKQIDTILPPGSTAGDRYHAQGDAGTGEPVKPNPESSLG